MKLFRSFPFHAAVVFALLMGWLGVTFAQVVIPQFPITGPSLISGSALNAMVNQLNTISANYVVGTGVGVKVASGETALDGTNPTPVTTGLTTITSCSLTIKTTSAPGVSTSVLTYGSSAGTLNMYGWKVTATGDATLIASTGTDTIGWVCAGT